MNKCPARVSSRTLLWRGLPMLIKIDHLIFYVKSQEGENEPPKNEEKINRNWRVMKKKQSGIIAGIWILKLIWTEWKFAPHKTKNKNNQAPKTAWWSLNLPLLLPLHLLLSLGRILTHTSTIKKLDPIIIILIILINRESEEERLSVARGSC